MTLYFSQKLLQIVKQKAEVRSVDITLKFTLSALWNLTDESPPTCAIFYNEGGLDLFIQILEVSQAAKQIYFCFRGLTFHIPLTKSAALNRLLHCSQWRFSGALLLFSRALFCILGVKLPRAPVVFFFPAAMPSSQLDIHFPLR